MSAHWRIVYPADRPDPHRYRIFMAYLLKRLALAGDNPELIVGSQYYWVRESVFAAVIAQDVVDLYLLTQCLERVVERRQKPDPCNLDPLPYDVFVTAGEGYLSCCGYHSTPPTVSTKSAVMAASTILTRVGVQLRGSTLAALYSTPACTNRAMIAGLSVLSSRTTAHWIGGG